MASQESIKELGQNGGGYVNANSSHPFENPNGLTNWLQMATILLIPFSLTYAFGRWTGDQKQGWVIFAAMFTLWIALAALAMGMETHGNPELTARGADQSVTSTQTGGNMEGKETRFDAATCGLYAGSTTGTSTGAVDCMHDSLDAAGRHGPDGEHDVQRGQPRRYRCRALRHVDLRAAGRVHRRPHGRAHARVPRQEDPGGRDEAGRDLHPRGPACRARLRRRLGGDERLRGLHPQPWAPRPVRGGVRLHLGRRTTTGRPSVASPATPTGTTSRSVCRCCSAGSSSSSPRSPSPARWPASRRCPPRPAPSRPARRCSPACSSAWSSIIVGLTYFPVLALGPIVEHLSI